jgi:hypothetical protein
LFKLGAILFSMANKSNALFPDCGNPMCKLCHADVTPDVWTYSGYRATLKRNGKFFAIVTPNGSDALSERDREILLAKLNQK